MDAVRMGSEMMLEPMQSANDYNGTPFDDVQGYLPRLRPLSVAFPDEQVGPISPSLALVVAQAVYIHDATSDGIRWLGTQMTSPAVVNRVGAFTVTATIGAATIAAPLTAHAAPGAAPAAPKTLTIQSGDTLSKLAEKYLGSADRASDIAKLNGLADPDKLQVGDVLKLPNGSAAASTAAPASQAPTIIVVQAGDTLRKISVRVFGDESRVQDIVELNGMKNPDRIEVGDKLKMPASNPTAVSVSASRSTTTAVETRSHAASVSSTKETKTSEAASLSLSGSTVKFIWPARGTTESGGEYGSWRGGTGAYAYHTGLDLAAPSGTAIVAVAGGKVTHAGPEGSYGHTVVVDHGNGYKTRYAHLMSWKVDVGDKVNQGQLLGLMGSTGFSTGTHLHFEVIKDGKFINPSSVLP